MPTVRLSKKTATAASSEGHPQARITGHAVYVLFGRLSCLGPFAVEKAGREAAASAARPEASGKTALSPQNDRPYGVKRKAFHTENALVGKPLANACGAGAISDTIGTR